MIQKQQSVNQLAFAPTPTGVRDHPAAFLFMLQPSGHLSQYSGILFPCPLTLEDFNIYIFFNAFFPLPYMPLILPTSSTCYHHTIVHVHESFFLFAQFPHPLTTPSPELSACSLSVSLSLFCLLVHFVP